MLKGRGWTFLLPGLSKTASFPSGFSAPHEAEVLASSGEFIGGMGLIMASDVSYMECSVSLTRRSFIDYRIFREPCWFVTLSQ
jgi:hypothetical protein